MSKNGIRGYITLAVILIVFSVIAFAAPFSMTVSFWLAYIFGVIAIAYQIYVFKISFSGDGDVKSKFYGFPIAKVGVIYLAVQLIISLIEMCIAAIMPGWIVLIINIISIAVAMVGCIAADAVKDEILRQDVQLKKDVTNMRTLQSLASSFINQCTDDELKRTIQDMSEQFKYSDPVSSDQTKEVEKELKTMMEELQKAILDGDIEGAKILVGKIVGVLCERNRICVLSK